jgi:thioredoxin 1
MELQHMKFNELIATDTPLLVDFFAEWCGPCKMMKPILNDVKLLLGEQVRIIKIDVDKNPAIAQQFSIQGVPTLMLFKNSEILWRQSGVVQASRLAEIIKKYV